MKTDKLFMGRVMNCRNCGFSLKSSLDFDSMFTTVEMDGEMHDFCPKCFGVPRRYWPREVKIAYDAFIAGKQASDKKDGQ